MLNLVSDEVVNITHPVVVAGENTWKAENEGKWTRGRVDRCGCGA